MMLKKTMALFFFFAGVSLIAFSLYPGMDIIMLVKIILIDFFLYAMNSPILPVKIDYTMPE